MPAIAITSVEEWKEKIKSGAVVVDFEGGHGNYRADHPCTLNPIFYSLSDEKTSSGVTFLSVDVDDVPDVAEEVGIRATPTVWALKDGQKVDEVVGPRPDLWQVLIRKVRDMVAA